jgi:hypothetical protein
MVVGKAKLQLPSRIYHRISIYWSNYTSIFYTAKRFPALLKVQYIQQDSPASIENSEESWAARQVAQKVSTSLAPAASAPGLIDFLTGYG